MDALAVLIAALLGVPAGWIALVLIDRVPAAASLVAPRPAVPFPRGFRTGDGLVYGVTVGLFTLAALRFDGWAVAAPHMALYLLIVALAVIDIEYLRLPDRLVFPASLGAVVLIGLVSWFTWDTVDPLERALVGGAAYFVVLLLAHLVYPRGMGFGDVKVSFLLGMFVGWPAPSNVDALGLMVWAMFLGFMLGSLMGIGILVFRKKSDPYPFGPFLFLGAVLITFVGADLLPRGDELLF